MPTQPQDKRTIDLERIDNGYVIEYTDKYSHNLKKEYFTTKEQMLKAIGDLIY